VQTGTAPFAPAHPPAYPQPRQARAARSDVGARRHDAGLTRPAGGPLSRPARHDRLSPLQGTRATHTWQYVRAHPLLPASTGGSPRRSRAHVALEISLLLTTARLWPESRRNRTEHQLSSGHRSWSSLQATPGQGTVHAVRYGRAVTVSSSAHQGPDYLESHLRAGGPRTVCAGLSTKTPFNGSGTAFRYESLVPGVASNGVLHVGLRAPGPDR